MYRLHFFAILLLLCACNSKETVMNIATYNLRYDNWGDSVAGNGWHQRCPVIAGQILFNDFDIFGTQEGLHHQLEDLKNMLPGYEYFGVGRDDGQFAGEFAAIFYKTDRFELLEHGDFWMSTITDRPNRGWDAALPRICTWGKFVEKQTGFAFLCFNLHMDHIGVEARRESCKLILDKVQNLPEKIPVILMGDFNVDQFNESYILLNTSGIMQDAYDLSPVRYANNGTFNGFNINVHTNRRIDHIFLTPQFTVQRYGILTDIYWMHSPEIEAPPNRQFSPRYPSDHFPVVVQVTGRK